MTIKAKASGIKYSANFESVKCDHSINLSTAQFSSYFLPFSLTSVSTYIFQSSFSMTQIIRTHFSFPLSSFATSRKHYYQQKETMTETFSYLSSNVALLYDYRTLRFAIRRKTKGKNYLNFTDIVCAVNVHEYQSVCVT